MHEPRRPETVVYVLVPFVPQEPRQQHRLLVTAQRGHGGVAPEPVRRELGRDDQRVMPPGVDGENGAGQGVLGLRAEGVDVSAVAECASPLDRVQRLRCLVQGMDRDRTGRGTRRLVVEGGGGASGIQGFVQQKWPNIIFPLQNLICPLRTFLTDPGVGDLRRGVGCGGGGGEGCIGRQGTSEAAPEALRQAVGGGCRGGWGQLLSVTNAIEPGVCRQGDGSWA